ncbi:MAG: hypothetical protein ACXWW6_04145 [Candidatus Limnocylindrales bacterium]
MIGRSCRSSPCRHLPGSATGLALAALVIFGACDSVAPRPSPSAPASDASVTPSPVASAGASETAASGQTDTDWGRIWDALPAGFPTYPGTTPAGEVERGPVSAALIVDGQDARAVATWMQTELERAGFASEALNGPLEDGSFVLESVGGAGCRIEVSVAPLGGLTTILVRYGAACPSP